MKFTVQVFVLGQNLLSGCAAAYNKLAGCFCGKTTKSVNCFRVRMLHIIRKFSQVLPSGFREYLSSTQYVRHLRDGYRNRQILQKLDQRPGLKWHKMPDCPCKLLDAAALQIGDALFVFGGLQSANEVNRNVLKQDLQTGQWHTLGPLPDGLSDSHLAAATDGKRYIYLASGQLGGNCRPAVKSVYSYDTHDGTWRSLPDVPYARYAASLGLCGGKLHFIGGAAEDRWTPTDQHLSLSVNEGVAQETMWRTEIAIPIPGMHRGCVVLNDRLYVFGGQQGDFQPIPDDPECLCTNKTQEDYLASTFRLSADGSYWEKLADMPIAASHLEFSSVTWEGRIFALGGQIYKHPDEFYLKLTNVIQCYDPDTNEWIIYDYLAQSVKTCVVAQHNGELFYAGGQIGKGELDRTGPISAQSWRAKMLPVRVPPDGSPPIPVVKDRDVLLITHRINYSGAPLVIAEVGAAMMRSGARVKVVSAADDVLAWNAFCNFRLPVLPIEKTKELAVDADLIIANTTAQPVVDLVSELATTSPDTLEKMVWWVHEIDREFCAVENQSLKHAKLVAFDSAGAREVWNEAGLDLPDAPVIHPAVSDELIAQTADEKLPFSRNPLCDADDEAETFSRAEIRAHLGVEDEDFLVTLIGTMKDAKGQRLLLKTLTKLSQDKNLKLRLLFVGFESEWQRSSFLSSLSSEERGLLSPKRAYLFQRNIAAFYKASDAFVLNTQGETGRGEAFGRVVIEAMAFGTPVLATQGGGVPEIITDGETGMLYPLGDEGQTVLAEKLTILAEDRERARAIGEAGRMRVNAVFREKRMLTEVNDLLVRLLNSR